MSALDALTLARSEVAALLAERDKLRAEVERARADERALLVARMRDLADDIERGAHEEPAPMLDRMRALAARLASEEGQQSLAAAAAPVPMPQGTRR